MSIIRNILNSTLPLLSNSLPTTGSNVFIGSQTITGSVIANSLTGSLAYSNLVSTPTLVSGSDQVISILSSLNSFSASNENTSLNSFSASQEAKNSTLATYTGSVDTKNSTLATYTASIETKFSTLATTTSSLLVSETNLNTYTGSLLNAFQVTGSKINFLGDVVIYGTQSVINSQNVQIADNIIYLSPTSSVDNDLGIVGHYNDGTYRHAGIFMDASDGHTWKVFNGLQDETLGTVNTSGTGFTLADFKAGVITGTSFTGNILSTNGVVSGSSQITFSGISSLPTLVSGSSQVTLSSTTGFGTYINQALLTSSSPTFVDTTLTGNLAGTTATFAGAVNITGGDALLSLTETSPATKKWLLGVGYNANGAFEIIDAGTGAGNTSRLKIDGSTGTTTITGAISASSATFSDTIGATRFISNVTNNYGVVLNRASTSVYNGMSLQTAGSVQWFLGMRENLTSNNYIAYSEITQADVMTLNVSNNNATFAGTITENSSLRYKENIETINNGLDKVLQMRGVTYDKKNTGVKELGVIAEEIYEVLPEVVLKNEEGEVDSVSYGRITAVLIEAIKDLKKEIEDLKANR